MIKRITDFEELALRASCEEMPRVDVRSRVLESIAESSTSLSFDQIAFRFLLGSMSMAALAVVVARLFFGNEPPLEMITPFIPSRL